MSSGGSVIRGSRVGSKRSEVSDFGTPVDYIEVSYWDALGNETVKKFIASISEEDIPEFIDSPKSGLMAGRDKDNPPPLPVNEPYKTHLAYVKERRTEAEAEELLSEAIKKYRSRRGLA